MHSATFAEAGAIRRHAAKAVLKAAVKAGADVPNKRATGAGRKANEAIVLRNAAANALIARSAPNVRTAASGARHGRQAMGTRWEHLPQSPQQRQAKMCLLAMTPQRENIAIAAHAAAGATAETVRTRATAARSLVPTKTRRQ